VGIRKVFTLILFPLTILVVSLKSQFEEKNFNFNLNFNPQPPHPDKTLAHKGIKSVFFLEKIAFKKNWFF
jgi:hypothetical protein